MRYLILLALSCSALGMPQPQVPKGEPTSIWSFPYIVSLQQSFGNHLWQHACAGTQLSAKTIVTAADCFNGAALRSSWRIQIGSDNWNSGGTVHYVSKIIVHENFNVTSKENNVAVVILETKTPYVAPPSTAMYAYYLPHGEPVTVAGWPIYAGYVKDNEVLHATRDVRVVDNGECAKRWRQVSNNYNVTASMFCTGLFEGQNEIKNSCVGNMGSPILHKPSTGSNVVVGIYSWGYDCANGDHPGVSTRYADVYKWVSSKIEHV